MKKYDSKAGKSLPQDLQARRQMEDRIFNRLLVWLAVAAVAEIFFVIVNRFYVHARAGEINAMVAWHNVLFALLFVGLALFVICLLWGRSKRAKGIDTILPYAMAGGFLVLGLGSIAIRLDHNASHLVLGVIPGLAILVIIFYLYQKEFFPCALVSALGILALIMYRISGEAGKEYILGLALTLIVAGVCLLMMLTLKKNEGVMTLKGKPVQVLSGEANYVPYFITVVVALLITLCPLALGGAAAYYGIWALGAWVFILAVYFTSKLM